MKKTTQLKNLKIKWIEKKIDTKYGNNINLKWRREIRDRYISEIIKYKRGMCEREVVNNIYYGYCEKDDRIKDIYLEYKKASRNRELLWEDYKRAMGYGGILDLTDWDEKEEKREENRPLYLKQEMEAKKADELYKLLIEKQKENYKKDILNSLEITEDEMNEGLAIVLNFCEKNNIWI